MVVVKLRGGLGNQLFQYAAARSQALARGTSVGFDCGYFDIKKKRTYELASFCVAGRPLSRLRLPLHYALERAGWSSATTLDGFFQSERHFMDARATIRADLRPRATRDARFDALSRDLTDNHSVCVHVRRGDYASSAQVRERFGALSPRYYALASERLLAAVPRPRYFIFSDDVRWAERYVKPALVGGDTVMAPDATGVEHLSLMASCRHYLIANSTFSWWAAWLGERDGTTVVAPWPWFRLAESPGDILPERWTRVPSHFEDVASSN